MDSVDTVTARLQAATISSRMKSREAAKGLAPKFESAPKKTSPLKARILSLTHRIGIGRIPKMVPAEDINHDTTEGRKIFYDQIVYLLQIKVPASRHVTEY